LLLTFTILIENRFHLDIEMQTSLNKITTSLRDSNYKITPQRKAILKTIAQSRDHLTPISIYKLVQQQYPSIGLVTIYRTLDILTGLGLLCKVHADENCQSYLLKRPEGHHHHLVCSGCGTVLDCTGCDIKQMEKQLARETGFKINSHLLEFSGQCPKCQKLI
jgi:Fur family transcriptional regulator, ferric uptake regulator